MLVELHSPRPRPKRPTATRAFRRVVQVIAEAEGLSPADLLGATRGAAPVAAARQTAMYLCHVAVGSSLTEVARFFGRDRTTVAHACRLIEDRRDDKALDRRQDALERRCLEQIGLGERT